MLEEIRYIESVNHTNRLFNQSYRKTQNLYPEYQPASISDIQNGREAAREALALPFIKRPEVISVSQRIVAACIRSDNIFIWAAVVS